MAWIYIDDFNVLDDTEQIHVDTRDFHVTQNNEVLDLKDGKHKELTKVFYKNDYLIDRDEIKSFIKSLETITGGKGSWRFMAFRTVSDPSGWFKYVRFYKVNRGKNAGKFVVCSRENNPVKWREMTKENFNPEHLNFIGVREDGCTEDI